jgi:hypothetical protein
MLGNIVYNIKNKLRPASEAASDFDSTNNIRSQTGILNGFRLNKLFNLRYLSVRQNDYDDEYNQNGRAFMMDMFPRVISQHPEDCELWSPISLAPTPKLPEYMDNVVDKFVRVIDLNERDLANDRLNANAKTPQKIQKLKNVT